MGEAASPTPPHLGLARNRDASRLASELRTCPFRLGCPILTLAEGMYRAADWAGLFGLEDRMLRLRFLSPVFGTLFLLTFATGCPNREVSRVDPLQAKQGGTEFPVELNRS